jgi:hypothetical protein
MDPAATVGFAMTMRSWPEGQHHRCVRSWPEGQHDRWVAAAIVLLLFPLCAAAQPQRFGLIVSGAAGGSEYTAQYTRWTDDLSKTLVESLKFDPAFVTVLSDSPQPSITATGENVRRALVSVRDRMTRDDVLLVVLIGHGTFDGSDAKFNLVGRDLESAEWAALLRPLPGTVVMVNTTSVSFPFLEKLSGPRRVIITATDSVVQRFDTVFPEYFIRALTDDSADIDKNGRISIWEAFAFASAAVRRHFQQRGQLSTERALLDDNGDGTGKDPSDRGEDGSLASRTYIDQSLPGAAPTDEVLLKLLQRKSLLEGDIEDLKIRKGFLPRDQYAKEFERLMIELAQVSHDIRARTKS